MNEVLSQDDYEKKVKEWLDGPGRKWGFSLTSDGKKVCDGMCHGGYFTFEEIYRRWIEPSEQRKHKKKTEK